MALARTLAHYARSVVCHRCARVLWGMASTGPRLGCLQEGGVPLLRANHRAGQDRDGTSQ